ncbi:MAG: hypothetical protein QXI58_02645 [Candidatus Micrarchaeia archaeon]
MANALTFSSWGRKIGIEVKYPIYIQVSLPPKSDAVLYAGRPVTLDADGNVIPVTSNVEVLGLVRAHKNQYVNEVSNDYGMYGSGLVSVVVSGLVEISPNYFTNPDGTETVVANYENDFLTAALMSKVYVNVEKGTLTTVADASNSNTFVGYLLRKPTSTDPRCLILLK